MNDTKTWAKRAVAGGELYLRRPPGGKWEVSLYHRVVNPRTALMAGVLYFRRLDSRYFQGKTFDSPDEAADTIRRLVA